MGWITSARGRVVYEKEQKLESILTKRPACRKASCTTSWLRGRRELHARLAASCTATCSAECSSSCSAGYTVSSTADCTARCCVPGTVRCITRCGAGSLCSMQRSALHTTCAHLAAWFAAMQANTAGMIAQLRTSFGTKLPSHARLPGPFRVRLAVCSFGKKKSPRRWLLSESHRSLQLTTRHHLKWRLWKLGEGKHG
jgi:hypothetical protein